MSRHLSGSVLPTLLKVLGSILIATFGSSEIYDRLRWCNSRRHCHWHAISAARVRTHPSGLPATQRPFDRCLTIAGVNRKTPRRFRSADYQQYNGTGVKFRAGSKRCYSVLVTSGKLRLVFRMRMPLTKVKQTNLG